MIGTPAVAMTVAGTDSGGSAGLACDLKTFLGCGVHGVFAVTAVTVQNSVGVSGVHEIPPETVAAQVDAVAGDIGVRAAKTGMLASAPIVEAVAAAFARNGIGRGLASPLVVDPVAASMHGDPLLRADALDAYRNLLFPAATVITPNLDEVRLLTGIEVRNRADAEKAALALHAYGPEWVLVKGGHLHDAADAPDLLFDGAEFVELTAPRDPSPHTHGGGDCLAAAITAALARGAGPVDAARAGKEYVTRAVAGSYPLGAGVGPVGHFWRLG
jgi:hydroxymethylpyrimidine/phosphomethylpyrimidine kinase